MPSKQYNNRSQKNKSKSDRRKKTRSKILRKKNKTFRKNENKKLGGDPYADYLKRLRENLLAYNPHLDLTHTPAKVGNNAALRETTLAKKETTDDSTHNGNTKKKKPSNKRSKKKAESEESPRSNVEDEIFKEKRDKYFADDELIFINLTISNVVWNMDSVRFTFNEQDEITRIEEFEKFLITPESEESPVYEIWKPSYYKNLINDAEKEEHFNIYVKQYQAIDFFEKLTDGNAVFISKRIEYFKSDSLNFENNIITYIDWSDRFFEFKVATGHEIPKFEAFKIHPEEEEGEPTTVQYKIWKPSHYDDDDDDEEIEEKRLSIDFFKKLTKK